MAVCRTNTLFLHLEENIRATPLEVHDFILSLGLAAEDVVAIQYGWNRNDVFVKLTREEIVEKTLERNLKTQPFPKGNPRGRITVERAAGSPVNVKILCLPPEVKQEAVKEELSHYGKIIRLVETRWEGDNLIRALTGTRMARMVVAKNIPSYLSVAGHRAVIIYDGQRRTCARCGEEGHERRHCPRNFAGRSYAQAASGQDKEISETMVEERGRALLDLEEPTRRESNADTPAPEVVEESNAAAVATSLPADRTEDSNPEEVKKEGAERRSPISSDEESSKRPRTTSPTPHDTQFAQSVLYPLPLSLPTPLPFPSTSSAKVESEEYPPLIPRKHKKESLTMGNESSSVEEGSGAESDMAESMENEEAERKEEQELSNTQARETQASDQPNQSPGTPLVSLLTPNPFKYERQEKDDSSPERSPTRRGRSGLRRGSRRKADEKCKRTS